MQVTYNVPNTRWSDIPIKVEMLARPCKSKVQEGWETLSANTILTSTKYQNAIQNFRKKEGKQLLKQFDALQMLNSITEGSSGESSVQCRYSNV